MASVSFWRNKELGTIELLQVKKFNYSFSRHIHKGFAIGVIEQGAEVFSYKGDKYSAPAGSIVAINPEEVHTGQAAHEMGCSYRVMYADACLLQKIASEIDETKKNIPFFEYPVIRDNQLAQLICELHSILGDSASRLEQESRLEWILGQLILRHANRSYQFQDLDRENWRVKQIKEFLEEHYIEDVSLRYLSYLIGLSPFYLTRLFQKKVGLPPHAYLTQVRVMAAKKLLASGYPIARTAYDTGFVDQSHFTKKFKRLVGVTPGQYICGSNNIQDKPL